MHRKYVKTRYFFISFVTCRGGRAGDDPGSDAVDEAVAEAEEQEPRRGKRNWPTPRGKGERGEKTADTGPRPLPGGRSGCPVAAPARASLPGGDPADRCLASPQGRRPRAAATCPAARRSGGGRTSVGARSGSWHRRVPQLPTPRPGWTDRFRASSRGPARPAACPAAGATTTCQPSRSPPAARRKKWIS